jgi:hypothetical protein
MGRIKARPVSGLIMRESLFFIPQSIDQRLDIFRFQGLLTPFIKSPTDVEEILETTCHFITFCGLTRIGVSRARGNVLSKRRR